MRRKEPDPEAWQREAEAWCARHVRPEDLAVFGPAENIYENVQVKKQLLRRMDIRAG